MTIATEAYSSEASSCVGTRSASSRAAGAAGTASTTASTSRCSGAGAAPSSSRHPSGVRRSPRTVDDSRTCAPLARATAAGSRPRPPGSPRKTGPVYGVAALRACRVASSRLREAAAGARSWGRVACRLSRSARPAYTPPSSGSTRRSTTSRPSRRATRSPTLTSSLDRAAGQHEVERHPGQAGGAEHLAAGQRRQVAGHAQQGAGRQRSQDPARPQQRLPRRRADQVVAEAGVGRRGRTPSGTRASMASAPSSTGRPPTSLTRTLPPRREEASSTSDPGVRAGRPRARPPARRRRRRRRRRRGGHGPSLGRVGEARPDRDRGGATGRWAGASHRHPHPVEVAVTARPPVLLAALLLGAALLTGCSGSADTASSSAPAAGSSAAAGRRASTPRAGRRRRGGRGARRGPGGRGVGTDGRRSVGRAHRAARRRGARRAPRRGPGACRRGGGGRRARGRGRLGRAGRAAAARRSRPAGRRAGRSRGPGPRDLALGRQSGRHRAGGRPRQPAERPSAPRSSGSARCWRGRRCWPTSSSLEGQLPQREADLESLQAPARGAARARPTSRRSP